MMSQRQEIALARGVVVRCPSCRAQLEVVRFVVTDGPPSKCLGEVKLYSVFEIHNVFWYLLCFGIRVLGFNVYHVEVYYKPMVRLMTNRG